MSIFEDPATEASLWEVADNIDDVLDLRETEFEFRPLTTGTSEDGGLCEAAGLEDTISIFEDVVESKLLFDTERDFRLLSMPGFRETLNCCDGERAGCVITSGEVMTESGELDCEREFEFRRFVRELGLARLAAAEAAVSFGGRT